MADIVWVSGASSGIGRALVDAVPWPTARVIGVSRRPVAGIEHLALDLGDPADWERLGVSFEHELAGAEDGRAVFFHAAGTLDPMGFAGEVDTEAYRRNVLLNSASPQVLGNLFLAAARRHPARRCDLIFVTSGAARSIYPGWSSYGAAKAAVDQWARTVGAEQEVRGGAHVMAVGPGTVDTGMQARIRGTAEDDFPQRQKFLDLHHAGKLSAPEEVAARMWGLLDAEVANGSVVDLRDLT